MLSLSFLISLTHLLASSHSHRQSAASSTMGDIQQGTPHIVIVPTPGMGHLIPLVEFAKRLVTHHDFSVTILIPSESSPSRAQQTVVRSLPKSITYVFLPPVDLGDLSEDAMIETRLCLTIIRSLSSLRCELQNIMVSRRVVAFVGDLFGTDTFDVAKELKLPFYMFYAASAFGLSFAFGLPKLDDTYVGEYKDMGQPVTFPGCVPLHGSDFVKPAHDRKSEAYRWLLHQCKRNALAEGILVNSFLDLEPGALKALSGERPNVPPVYPVGPLVALSDNDGVSECVRWLENQPIGSVLFISFGSGGTHSYEQLTELALGLEKSGQRFLWVARSPSDKTVDGSYLNTEGEKGPFEFLPTGFLQRTSRVGLVVSSWAPQIEVLSHRSTGGFLTHCGWNSTLESVVHGVPLIAWPLYAEQKMNAVMLGDMKIALRLKCNENGLISREEIARVVNNLMKGEGGKQVRNKVEELKGAAARVLSEVGSSSKSLREVALKWKNNNLKIS